MFACDKFAKVEMHADVAMVAPEDREVLAIIIEAAKFLNPVYLRQVSTYNPQFKQEIEDSHSKKLIESFEIMAGPWDRFDNDRPFYGTIEKPAGAGFYPADLTREAFELWCDSHPESRKALTSYTTVVRRVDGGLCAVPYSEAYELELRRAAELLSHAAHRASSASLKRFLKSRAEALLSNDYAQADADWIALDHSIECVFGPYETYEDRLFGYKATFEAFIGYRIPEETRRLKHFSDIADDMHEALPISEEMKKTRRAQPGSPFVVIDLLSTAGEARAGVQTLAFVLPNEPSIVSRYGTKKVMMRNVQRAKFDAILKPIAKRFLAADALGKVSFDAFFRHTILHETGHSLGPKAVKNSKDSISMSLSTAYAPLEECKADTISTFLSFWLFDRGELGRVDVEQTCATMLAGFFRSMRFGLSQAHARANAIQLNFYEEHGAVMQRADGTFSCDVDKMRQTTQALIAKIAQLQYDGDRIEAEKFLAKYAVLDAGLESRLRALDDIPVDITCVYDAEKPGFFTCK